MDRSAEGWTIHEGTEVFGSDGEKVGKVTDVQSDFIVVEKGFFFPTDYYIPLSAVADYDDDNIRLNVTSAAALEEDWGTAPITSDEGYADPEGTWPETRDGDQAYATSDRETLRIPVSEEELTATRREVDRGEVRVDKHIVAEEQAMDVPVREERVNVQRRIVNRDVTPDDATFEETTIDVPLRAEVVDVETRARVAEEVEITKEPVERVERVRGTVRREEVSVDESDTGVLPDPADEETERGRRSR